MKKKEIVFSQGNVLLLYVHYLCSISRCYFFSGGTVNLVCYLKGQLQI